MGSGLFSLTLLDRRDAQRFYGDLCSGSEYLVHKVHAIFVVSVLAHLLRFCNRSDRCAYTFFVRMFEFADDNALASLNFGLKFPKVS